MYVSMSMLFVGSVSSVILVVIDLCVGEQSGDERICSQGEVFHAGATGD